VYTKAHSDILTV